MKILTKWILCLSLIVVASSAIGAEQFRKPRRSPTGSPTLAPFIAAYYSCDEASGNLLDSHTGAHTAVETSGTIARVAGKVGNACDFEAGDTEWAAATNHADFNIGTGDASWVFWANMESTASAKYIFSRRDSTNGYGIFIASTSSGITTQTGDGTNQNTVISSLTTATWAQIVVTRSGTVLTLYKDGTLVNTGTARGGSLDFAGDFVIGMASDLTSFPFDGLIDELIVFKGKALNQTEVTFLYGGGNGTTYAQVAAYAP